MFCCCHLCDAVVFVNRSGSAGSLSGPFDVTFFFFFFFFAFQIFFFIF